MPIPSEVPTSFVPHSTGVKPSITASIRIDFVSVFLYSVLSIFVLTVLTAGFIFVYNRSLNIQLSVKQTQLQNIEKTLNPSTVQSFVHLRDRLSSADTLINNHLTMSRVFNLLESKTVKNVSFTGLTLDVPDTNKPATIKADGIALNFNSLASEANSLKDNNNLTNTIFSNFSLKRNGTVGFSISANLDKSLVQNFAGIVAVDSGNGIVVSTTQTITNSLNNVTTKTQ